MKILNSATVAGFAAWLGMMPAARAQIVRRIQVAAPAVIECVAFGDKGGFMAVVQEKSSVSLAIFDAKGGKAELKEPGDYQLALYTTSTQDFKIRLRFLCPDGPGGKPVVPGEAELARQGMDIKATLVPGKAEGKSRHVLAVSDKPGPLLITLK